MSRTMTCAATMICTLASLIGAQQQQSGRNDAAAKVVYMSSATAKYANVPDAPISQAQLFGDANADAPHGEFITFPPNLDAGGWHVHTNTVNLVVLKGAYIYRDASGEKRVGPGEFIRIPGGHRHWSGSDAKEGAVFYMHQQARMDQKPVK
jgi:mannose-6-phosphate isomerase-like protein (cupin superfamily)